MSLRPRVWPEVPGQTVQVATLAFPRGALAMRVRDRLPELFPDAEFASSFGAPGRPGLSPGLLALVTVLQFVEGLTDRQAAEAVRGRIDWKYALGLELTDPGFDHTVLTGFRTRLVEHSLEEKVLDLLLARLSEQGLVTPGGRQRTDSTHVLAAVRTLNRLELVSETLRAALEALAAAAPDWLAGHWHPEWAVRYAARQDGWRLPSGKPKRAELAQRTGIDGFALLDAVADPRTPGWLREIPALDVLRTVWVQQYQRAGTDGQEVSWREDEDLPPARDRICSPYDLDARYGVKRGSGWCGYKLHLTGGCDDPAVTGRPRLITHVATTAATVTDVETTETVHTGLARRGMLPGEHVVDSGYVSAEQLLAARREHEIVLLGPLRRDGCAQAKAGAGFDRPAFTIDWNQRRVSCPQGQLSTRWSPSRQQGRDVITVGYPAKTCKACPVRAQCTTARGGRQLTLRPREIEKELQRARTEQDTEQWRQRYRIRAGAESDLHQILAVTGVRHSRYTGLAKTHQAHLAAAVAINLVRLDTWWTTPADKRTRPPHHSHLTRLSLTLAA